MPIEIGGIQLPRVHRLATLEQATLAAHRIPGLEGSVVQDLGRASVQLQVEGIFYGATANDDLEALRALYKNRKPVDFLAEIVGEAYFSQVVITHFEVFEVAGNPDELSYVLHVLEYVEPPQPEAASDLAAVDGSILDDAQSFMAAALAAASLPDLIASIPNISNPLTPLAGAMDGVEAAMNKLGGVTGPLQSLFGVGGS
ncbi:MAG: DNA circularization N-terminal domain-containing protein [Acidobacteria bacterium]|nr:DNA circularization N-terminal domain-containing protein [Acidobacteriota bacterium]